ncbi:FKBP-like peptidyl-prolyl cis-trans isomerase family protein [Euphorbia peplus]|nr:FKBP-like peptidyl-prolyl cis-trans isomerase family protein [Euphorbia peplus]
MAFWGVEVKPGKPFTQLPGNTGQRLHLSQATLGLGTATKNSVVQCNVGNRSPVFLCSLFPYKSESCQLHLEFEEVDEVVFSVIGPRSVHLTGYYLGAGRHFKLDDESESYGEDIVDTETERSPGVSDEEYEDSFINDDDELHVIPPSPDFSDRAEETSRQGRKQHTKSKRRRLKKTYQSSQTDESDDHASQRRDFSNADTSMMDSEGEDRAIIASLIKSDAKTRKSRIEELVDEDNSAAIGGKADAIIDSETKRKPHEEDRTLPSTVENNSKPKKKTKKQPKEGEVRAGVEDEFFSGQALTWNKTKENEKKVDQSNQDTTLMNGDGKEIGNDKGESQLLVRVPSEELITGFVEKTGKTKKKQRKEANAVGAESAPSNVNREDPTEQDKARCENTEQDGSLKNEENQKQARDEGEDRLRPSLPSNDVVDGIVAKNGKKKKKQAKETKTLKTDDPSNGGIGEDQSQPDEARRETIEQDHLLKNDEDEKQANAEGGNLLHLSPPSDEKVHGIVAKPLKRKKKQAKEEKSLGDVIPLNNVSTEDRAQPYEARCENIEQGSSLKSEDSQKQANDEGLNPLHSEELVHDIVAKTGKRKKQQAEQKKPIQADGTFSSKEDQTQPNEAGSENIMQDNMLEKEDQKQANDGNTVLDRPPVVLGLETLPKPKQKRKRTTKDKALEGDANNLKIMEDKTNIDEQNQMQTIKPDLDNNDEQSGSENHNRKKKKKKSRIQENKEVLNDDESMNTSSLDIKENNANGKTKKVSKAK